MGWHHVALATHDIEATHRFYSEVMGFRLVKTVVNRTERGGWAKHLFYETGQDEYIAFWDLHDDTIPDTWSAAISKGLGLPTWVNHIAFKAEDLDDIHRRRQRWVDHGLTVAEIDHGFCTSIYTTDPNNTMVEFCTTTVPFTTADHEEALRLLRDPAPDVQPAPPVTLHQPHRVSEPVG